ncbi:hypothetical protein ABCS02_10060 [Microbacterium sp. X-17]|uniref:hypothetical protein n=1 Tax=Microbacterium sp. X-17 TaxID=3144404 RepID=UPI0031F5458C
MTLRFPTPAWRRAIVFVAVAAFAGALLGQAVPGASIAASGADSSITVAWATGAATVGPQARVTADEVRNAQPRHAALSDGNGNDGGSGHWADFKNLTVTVGKTGSVGDEVLSVTVAGFPSATVTDLSNAAASNYVQAMQCWGPDPSAPDFYQTCQYGGYAGTPSAQNLVRTYGATRGTADVSDAENEVATTPYPFRAATGQVSRPHRNVNPGEAHSTYYVDGLEQFFTASSSNEVIFQPVDEGGRATFGFVAQSGASQPYLGCGSSGRSRCWLVVVPRGSHSGVRAGTPAEACDTGNPQAYGEVTSIQDGSPVAPDCSYFDDRVVVPLDFDPVGGSCAAGSVERRAVGSEFVAPAFSSWQQALCGTGTAFGLTTNSGNLVRSQLLAGQTQLGITAQRLAPGNIGTADPASLASADLIYAPLANTALVFGFVLSSPTRVYPSLKLTPRLIAKMLTQSYKIDIPSVSGSYTNPNYSGSASRDAIANNAEFVWDDPEWRAVGNPVPSDRTDKTALALTGPQGDDAVDLLWRYVLADADARAFLGGAPDPWGAIVNPYYLPPGNPRAIDGGYDLLSAPLDVFPKADRTLVPTEAVANENFLGRRIDSTSFLPYAGSFDASAARIARADSQRANEWDPYRGWVSAGPPLANGFRYLMGPVSAAGAAAYQLSTAAVALPLAVPTTKDSVTSARSFVVASDATLGAAVGSPGYDAVGGRDTDLTALPADAYPLTMTLYAAADRNSAGLDGGARSQYATLFRYAADAGQVRGQDPGNLPDGYVPLTDAQRTETNASAALLLEAKDGASPTPETPRAAAAPAGSGGPAAPAPSSQTQVTASRSSGEAPGTSGAGAPGAVLGGALVAGVAGLLVSPFLLRRRGSA